MVYLDNEPYILTIKGRFPSWSTQPQPPYDRNSIDFDQSIIDEDGAEYHYYQDAEQFKRLIKKVSQKAQVGRPVFLKMSDPYPDKGDQEDPTTTPALLFDLCAVSDGGLMFNFNSLRNRDSLRLLVNAGGISVTDIFGEH